MKRDGGESLITCVVGGPEAGLFILESMKNKTIVVL